MAQGGDELITSWTCSPRAGGPVMAESGAMEFNEIYLQILNF